MSTHTTDVIVRSCRDCPFSTPFSDACKHPDSPRTPRHGTQVKISDLNYLPTPETCPLRFLSIMIRHEDSVR